MNLLLHYIIQNSLGRLLLTLAVTDTIHLIASALTFSITNLSEEYAKNEWNYIVPYSLPIAQVGDLLFLIFLILSRQTSMTASVYLTISLTVERYFSVVKPFFRMKNK